MTNQYNLFSRLHIVVIVVVLVVFILLILVVVAVGNIHYELKHSFFIILKVGVMGKTNKWVVLFPSFFMHSTK